VTPDSIQLHRNLVYHEHHFKCSRCDLRTHYKCACGVALCNAGMSSRKAKGPCYFDHVLEKVAELDLR
jgi:hypothetical protein